MHIKDIAWAAGILEGEGCFTISKRSVGITVSMSDPDVIERLRNTLSKKKEIYLKLDKRENCKPLYRIDIFGTRAVEWLFTIYSFMGHRRKLRIRGLIAVWKENTFHSRSAQGVLVRQLMSFGMSKEEANNQVKIVLSQSTQTKNIS